MNVILSGESGFVGQNLKAYLRDNSDINLKYLKRVSNASSEDLTWENLGMISHTDAIIHLAGKAHDLANTAQPEEYYEVNFELTKRLYKVFLMSDAKKFIFLSSVKAAANKVEGELTEEVKPMPVGHYGKSKLMAEEYIMNEKLPPGKSYHILRPCMIHGPGNKGNLNLLYKLFILKRIPYPLAAFDNRRSFLSVENLCFTIKELLDRNDIPQGVYNIADSESLSTTEVITLLSLSTGIKPLFLNIPRGIIKFVSEIGDLFKLGLGSQNFEKLTENYVVSNQKIKQSLNKELPVSARDGILKTGQSFR